jgi:hypothetical protein
MRWRTRRGFMGIVGMKEWRVLLLDFHLLLVQWRAVVQSEARPYQVSFDLELTDRF